MGLLQTLMTDGPGPGGSDVPRWRQLLHQAGEDPRGILRMLNPRHWSERTVIALVMQHLDNSITTFTKRGKLGRRRYVSKQGHGEPNPSWIPVGNEATRRIAAKIDGVAGGTWGELFNIPLTAHFLGGAAIGDSPEHGVIDPYQRVYGYPTLFVADGAAISANLGVNPSLSITAQAERAASLWPNKGENDLRPRQGEPYRRLDPIAPQHPVVPADAPGALRWLPSAGDDAERSDAEERRIRPGPISSAG
jgi:cholesterol oxidase